MMLPLCTNVTLLRPLSIAYRIAARTRRAVPSCDTGLMPMPAVSGKRILANSSGKASLKSCLNFALLSLPSSNSIPA